MTYTDVVTQMQTIQAQLAQLGLIRSSASTTSTSATSAADFATALDGATATTDATTTDSTTASTDGTLVSANGTTGDDVVQAALAYKGTPYVLGGESKSGIDCSGLVQATFSNLGVSVPRLVHEQETVGQKVDSLKDAKPGDLIVLNGGDHIAIYMGNNTVIHAPYPGRTVSVQKAWFTDKDITSIRRIVPASDDATSTTGTTAASALATAGTTAAATTAAATAAATTGTSTTSSGLSADTMLKATAMLTTYGADVGLYSTSSDSSDSSSSGTSLSSLLASFGLSSSTSTSSATSSTASQQIIAARAALLGTSS
jgi:cell wall-associated NlpC family hydrolase